jgi:putative ABC transport system ATP-binding protein
MNKEIVVETRGLTKIYRVGEHEIRAVDNVDLNVPRGEFLSIMGPSGSGKTSLLNLIGCIDRPSEGKVLIEGRDVSELRERELNELRLRKIGFIFQTFNLLPTLTALENVEFPMELAGIPKQERLEEAKRLLSIVGLSERLHHRPSQLSVGERQRVGIARALANNPIIILADEPTGNVDSKTAAEIVALLKEINVKYDKTIILVTHNIEVAKGAERILQLKDGKILDLPKVWH